jgi:hypothetical protein
LLVALDYSLLSLLLLLLLLMSLLLAREVPPAWTLEIRFLPLAPYCDHSRRDSTW